MALHRHKVDLQLRESMQRYQAIVDTAAEGILLVSCGTKEILEANPSSIRLLGYTPGELSSMTVGELIADQDGQHAVWGDRVCTRKAGPERCSSGVVTVPCAMLNSTPVSSSARGPLRSRAWLPMM